MNTDIEKTKILSKSSTFLNLPLIKRWKKNLYRDKYLLLLVIPLMVYYIVFHYIPMYGVVIAFKDFSPIKGILGSSWAGMKWFNQFFHSMYFGRLISNTFLLGLYNLIWGFPIPIIFALMLNELRDGAFKRVVQTVSYMPHFVSTVVIVGMMVNFLSPTDGVVNVLIKTLGFQAINFINEPQWFRSLYVGSNIWQEFGWNSIIYLAALSSIDPQLYEAAKIDGASKWQQLLHITLPGIIPTIIILLILNVGSIMNVGFEKVLLLYSPSTYETGDVISTYVYRRGILNSEYSFGAAAGLFNAVINFTLLLIVNLISKKNSNIALW